MMNAVIKHSLYGGGQSVVIGQYINLSDKLCNYEFIGDTTEAKEKLDKMKKAGHEFQLVTIHELQ